MMRDIKMDTQNPTSDQTVANTAGRCRPSMWTSTSPGTVSSDLSMSLLGACSPVSFDILSILERSLDVLGQRVLNKDDELLIGILIILIRLSKVIFIYIVAS
jgi:hypothetical protein